MSQNKLVTLMDILSSSGKYPEREKDPSCDAYVHINAYELSERVSGLLRQLGVTSAKVSSGFRTPAANATAGGATKSAHMTGEAVDLEDPSGELGRGLMVHNALLKHFDLYLENPQYTKGWVHLQSRKTASGNRIFTP